MEKLQNLRFVIRDQTQWKKFSWEKVLDKIQQFSECTIPLSHFLVALLLSFCWQRFGIIWHSLIFIIPISFYFILSFINFKVARIFPKSFFFFSYHILFFFSFWVFQVYLYGGHVTSWKNDHGEELLFVSSKVLWIL